ncbi:hypothetical protein CGMCC3_g4315 [Colletotrichum fructicola]|nr:uncharacterized protein CGMCC3_g4315 [Colletotrichum fructicola]KAE9579747.1 hypothetical protein CGMCC3_g4315 [Colletotrichum fructicola]
MSAAPPSNPGSPDSPNREPTPADAAVQPEVQPENNPENVLTADDTEEEEGQSVDGRSLAPSTESLRPSLFDYRQENGRTYHRYKDGKYIFPNDERESDRLDMEFQIWMISLDDRLGVAPPCLGSSKPTRVLDIGTGTGIWAMHFGDEHPEAEVIGTDLSPIQPGFVPPNVKFEIDDLEDEWTYSLPFDYIHSRVMTSSIGDWSVYLRKCYENLKPVRKDFNDKSIHAYWPAYCIVGRKPETV